MYVGLRCARVELGCKILSLYAILDDLRTDGHSTSGIQSSRSCTSSAASTSPASTRRLRGCVLEVSFAFHGRAAHAFDLRTRHCCRGAHPLTLMSSCSRSATACLARRCETLRTATGSRRRRSRSRARPTAAAMPPQRSRRWHAQTRSQWGPPRTPSSPTRAACSSRCCSRSLAVIPSNVDVRAMCNTDFADRYPCFDTTTGISDTGGKAFRNSACYREYACLRDIGLFIGT
mmetsp:Transcript_7203/g.15961  ORF Transcript_7203/g.15961 Transcript_7203/m.15961 type:complete len:232 (+) Transcript_7203:383-1078(+)